MSDVYRGRVTRIHPEPDGRFAVTLVADLNGREFLWLRTERPPRLGDLLQIEPESARRYQDAKHAAVTTLDGGDIQVLPDQWRRRFVPPAWLRAAAAAASVRLFPHQLEGAGWLAERLCRGQGAMLADDQGLGKTLTCAVGLMVANALPALICAPAAVKVAWERELELISKPLHVEIIKGHYSAIAPAHVYIANYEILREREEQLKHLRCKVIVFDEAQFLKEPAPSPNHRAAVATRLAHAIGRAVLLSGTPLPNRTRELWRLLHIVDPRTWPDYEDFYRRYCRSPEKGDAPPAVPSRQLVTEHSRVYNVDELQARIAPVMMRRLKAEVLRDLPAKDRKTIPVELEEVDRAEYTKAEADIIKWLRQIGATDHAQNAVHQQTLAKLLALRRIAALGKLRRAVPALLHAWFARPQAEPMVIFGFHRSVMQGLHVICHRLGISVASIRSEDDQDRRQEQVDAFTAGQAQVFLAPIKCAGVGINLQRAATALFVERVWDPASMCQSEDRIHRLGQTKAVTILYLDAVRTIDQHMALVLEDKQRLIDLVVDDDPTGETRKRLRTESMAQVIGALRR